MPPSHQRPTITFVVASIQSNILKKSFGSKIAETLAYINHHYAQGLTLKEVALLMGIHPDYLGRRFKAETGIRFHDYLLRKRLEAACVLLRDSLKNIKEVCYECGFSDPQVFCKVFKKWMGSTPTLYRETRSAPSKNSIRVLLHI
ncbi:MAG: helix-turn-helix transcriptional regulator [Nitrospirae bacterium]|nr:helix-turn-helix transcriptional regulator [Nitrospirota bacterium]MBI3805336.1 helix-turn-helix transcriptional regulator [Candidatus Manganitrophaceae bacterium]